uniref:Uncharacterized protein n=1 Tax=Xenopus tropicalis TaxID=8364 RepID=A0A1B8XUT8_XENTR
MSWAGAGNCTPTSSGQVVMEPEQRARPTH